MIYLHLGLSPLGASHICVQGWSSLVRGGKALLNHEASLLKCRACALHLIETDTAVYLCQKRCEHLASVP